MINHLQTRFLHYQWLIDRFFPVGTNFTSDILTFPYMFSTTSLPQSIHDMIVDLQISLLFGETLHSLFVVDAQWNHQIFPMKLLASEDDDEVAT